MVDMNSKLEILEIWAGHEEFDFERFLNLRKILNKQYYKKWYKIYLKTKYWAELRKKVLSNNEYCDRCKVAEAVEVHHVSYKNLGKELDSDLIGLCSYCHCMAHGKKYIGTALIGSVMIDAVKEIEYNHKESVEKYIANLEKNRRS